MSAEPEKKRARGRRAERSSTSDDPSGAAADAMPKSGDDLSPPYLGAAIAGLAVFALYALTLGPTTAFWDTSEYIATGEIMGIPHPPGNPLFVVLARAWSILLSPLGLSPAVKINLFSALMSASAHGLWFLVVHHILRFFSEDRFFRLVGASAAVLVSATAFTVWNQSNVNEKVYTVSLLTIALLSWLAFRWQENLGKGKDDNLLVLMAFVLALSVGNHLMAFLAAPAIGLFILYVHPQTLLNWRLYVSATAFTVWNQSNVNEKVYTVSLLTIALLSWLAFRWQENLGKGKDDNLLVLMAFVLALSVGNHLMAFLAAPAIGLFILYVHPQTLLNWRLYVAGAAATVVGLTIHLFLPIRAGLGPVINEAAPTCPDIQSALAAVVTYGKAGCSELAAALNREQYSKPPLMPRLAPLSSQFVNYLQYFDWQWARSLDGANVVFPRIRLPFTMLFTGFGVWGALEHLRRDKASFLYIATLFGTLSVALVYYLNFKYGYSLQAPVPDRALHEVRERDYFFIVSFSLWGLWAGVGIATLWKEVAHETGSTLKKASPFLGFALIPLVLNWGWAARNDDYSARDWAYNLLMSVEPYSVLFTNGDNDTFPLWYLQEVEGIRRDVTVIVTSYLNTDWYAKQLRGLTTPCEPGQDPSSDWSVIQCQRPYTFENTDAAYVTDASQAGERAAIVVDRIQVPTKTILPLTDEQIEGAAQSYQRIDEPVALQIGNIRAQLPGGQFLSPWQQFGLRLLVESIEDRPIYFASSGNAAISLGVQPYLVRQGLAFRLHNGPVEDNTEGFTRLSPSPYTPVTGTWVDIERTERLADEVFVHRGDLPHGWDHWPDIATLGIPNYYAWVYLALMQGATEEGDAQAIARFREEAEAWSALGNL